MVIHYSAAVSFYQYKPQLIVGKYDEFVTLLNRLAISITDIKLCGLGIIVLVFYISYLLRVFARLVNVKQRLQI